MASGIVSYSFIYVLLLTTTITANGTNTITRRVKKRKQQCNAKKSKKTYRVRPNIAPKFRGNSDSEEKHFRFRRKTFFFGLHLISGEKTLQVSAKTFCFFWSSPNFRRRPFFWSSPNFRRKNTSVFFLVFT